MSKISFISRFSKENVLINVALFDQLSKQLYATILRRKQVRNIERALLSWRERGSQRGGCSTYTVSEENLKLTV